MSAATVLTIDNLHVRFPVLGGDLHAVRGASLEIATGDIVGLVGESGSGKSVTAMACLGLVPGSARVTGSVEVAGREVIERTERELRGLRGGVAAMIFQNPATAMNPFFTIGQQLVDVIRRHSADTRDRARRSAIEALESVHLPDADLALAKYPHQMSGGQLQRVMIAMAIACKPRLLIADEPTTALDVTIQAQIIHLIRDLVRERDLSVLFITHDLGVVASLCDHVAVMYAGSIVEEADVHRLFAAPAHPYTRRLLETVPELGAGGGELQAIPGQVPNLAALPSGCSFHPRCPDATRRCSEEPPPAYRRSGRNRGVACHHSRGGSELASTKPMEARR
jgi:peptide/nickel transport system ATP-binding protein